MKYPKGIKAIYDHPKYADRYTVYYTFDRNPRNGYYACLGMSEKPFHPLGFGQHGEGMLGRHNGKKITFEDLPADCKEAVMQDLECVKD